MADDVPKIEPRTRPEDADFFISRAGRNGDERQLAIRICRMLERHGHKVLLQDLDFGPKDFIAIMHRALAGKARVIALLSRAYLESEDCLAEAQGALGEGRSNEHQRLVVLRIEEVAPVGLFVGKPYTDLVPFLAPLDETRLEAAILRAIETGRPDDQGSLAIADRRHVTITHPLLAAAVPGFTGREADEAIGQVLWRDQGKHRAALTNVRAGAAAVSGMGGVGKSVLARQYAFLERERYQGVWLIRAEERDTLIDDLVHLGGHLVAGLDREKDRERAAHAAVAAIAAGRFQRPFLLVYDNAEGPDALSTFVPGEGAHVLITSRNPDFYGHAEELPIGVFPEEVAVRFLLDRARHGDPQEALALARDLGFLPLALSHARAHCWKMSWGFDAYRARAAELMRKAPGRSDYPTPVYATFSLAIERAAIQASGAERLMELLAFLSPDDIPLSLVGAEIMSEIEKGEAVVALSEGSLLALPPSGDGASVHRLVQAVMRERLREAGREEEVREKVADFVGDAFPAADSLGLGAGPVKDRLLPHGIASLSHFPDNAGSPAARFLAFHLGDWQQVRGDMRAAMASYLRAKTLAEALAKADPNRPEWQRDVSVSLDKIADVLRAAGDAKGALDNYKKSLVIAEALAKADPNRPEWQRDVSVSLDKIADVLRAAGDAKGALDNYKKSLVIAEALAKADPNRPEWQTDLVVSYFKLAEAGIEPQHHLSKAHAILKRLAAQDMLTAEQHKWIASIETRLAALGSAARPVALRSSPEPTAHRERRSWLARLLGRRP